MINKTRGMRESQQRIMKNAIELLPDSVQDTLLSSSAYLWSDAMGAFLDNYVEAEHRDRIQWPKARI